MKKLFQFFKKGLTALLMLCLSVSVMASGVQKVTIRESKQPFAAKLVDEKSNGLTVMFELNQLQLLEVKTDEGKAFVGRVPKTGSFLIAGVPDLPYLTQSIVIPDFGSAEIEILKGNYREIKDIDIAPSKGNLLRTVNPDDVPYVKGEVYQKNAFFPTEDAILREPFIMRDFRGQTIEVYPVQYNPVTRTLRIYETITVNVKFTDKPGINEFSGAKKSKIDSEFAQIYRDLFLNYNSAKYTPLQENGEMLIICFDNFVSAMQPFVNWKNSMGRKTTLVPNSQVGTTNTAIKNYITSIYNNPERNLTYVLLVGDAPQIPTNTLSTGHSDDAYGYILGNDSYNELFVGRFSAENVDHVQTMVDRIIHYERNINTSDTWLNIGLGVSKNEGAGQGHFGEADYQHIDYIRDTLLNFTYNIVYREYEGVSGLPNTTATSISEKINSGTSIINYCNHGSVTSWSVANYSNTHVNALTNVNKLPFIWSVACVNGNFVSNFCFAEAWMRATHNGQPTGAISVLMSTINQPWQPPMTGQDHMVGLLAECFQNNIKRTFGGLSVNGKFKMVEVHGSEGVKTHDTWAIFGDPTLLVRTDVPQNMIISHNPTIFIGNSSFTVSCDTEGALVAISRQENGVVYLLGTAFVSGGQAVVNFTEPLTQPSDLNIVVTAFNKVTYLNTISAVPANEPYVVLDSFTTSAAPDYGTTIDLNVTLKNISEVPYTASNVTAQLTTASNYVTINNGFVAAGNIEPGQSVVFNNAFNVSIANNVPNQTSLMFTINLQGTYNGQTYQWSQNFTIKANAPVLTIGGITIEDGGSGIPGVLDPGETAIAMVQFSNTGNAEIHNVIGTLASNSQYLEVLEPQATIVSLNTGQIVQVPFVISALANTPLETAAPVQITAQSGEYQATKNSTIIIGYIPEYNMSPEPVTACIGRFYDSGGPYGQYSNNENFTKTFFPASNNAVLLFNFTSFDVENNYDKLFIYNGTNDQAPQFPGSPFTGTTSPGTIMASNPEGAITFKFTSDNIVVKNGWSANFYCVDLSVPPACSSNPSPAVGATVTASPVTLSWDFVPGATQYDVYFGEGQLPQTPIATITATSYQVSVEDYSNYVWKVVPKNNVGEATGCEEWNFTTGEIAVVVTMQNGQITTCNALFYDSGGPNGNYQNNENLTYTFFPSTIGNRVRVTFTAFNVENNYDKLYIYNGVNESAPLLATLTGTTLPGSYVASNPQGALTFKFTSDASVVKAGWAATISCDADPNYQAQVLSFGFVEDVVVSTSISPVVNNFATINVLVVAGTNLTALTPQFTISQGATSTLQSGVLLDFSSPIDFTVTSANGLVTNTYRVIVEVEQIPTYLVSFVVYYNNQPVEGVDIIIDNQTITTNAQGTASIELAAGVYEYSVSKNGFNTIYDQLTVVDSNLEINLTLTGIEFLGLDNNIAIYPNPFSNELTFENVSTVMQLSVVDAIGRELIAWQNNGSSRITLATDRLNAGVYMSIFRYVDGTQLVVKIIKQ